MIYRALTHLAGAAMTIPAMSLAARQPMPAPSPARSSASSSSATSEAAVMTHADFRELPQPREGDNADRPVWHLRPAICRDLEAGGQGARHPVTPDGRYFVVRGRLWRCSDPSLPDNRRAELVRDLMRARSAVGHALRAEDKAAVQVARARVDAAKVALGERGPVWWSDGAPDFNRRLAQATPYADWFASLGSTGRDPDA
ncbi:MAG TPA: hypothetical protein VHN58_12035 [Croceicoccus sp.]|nr:hypothetical protein [Croceicoccus sp.]